MTVVKYFVVGVLAGGAVRALSAGTDGGALEDAVADAFAEYPDVQEVLVYRFPGLTKRHLRPVEPDKEPDEDPDKEPDEDPDKKPDEDPDKKPDEKKGRKRGPSE